MFRPASVKIKTEPQWMFGSFRGVSLSLILHAGRGTLGLHVIHTALLTHSHSSRVKGGIKLTRLYTQLAT